MSKSDIYSSSYIGDLTEETDEAEITPEDVARWKAMSERRKIGLLLRAEKAQAQGTQQKARRLQEENIRLTGIIRDKERNVAPHLRTEQKKSATLEIKVKRITEENRRLKLTVKKLEDEALLLRRR